MPNILRQLIEKFHMQFTTFNSLGSFNFYVCYNITCNVFGANNSVINTKVQRVLKLYDRIIKISLKIVEN